MDNQSNKGNIQKTLEEMKRRLQQEREASETLTRHLSVQRGTSQSVGDSRTRKLELDLAEARRQFEEQKAVAEALALKLTAGQDKESARRSETGTHAAKLEQELTAAREQLREQSEGAERLITQLVAERDQGRARLQEMESGSLALQQELAKVQAQLGEQQQAAASEIQRLTAERDEIRAQRNEVDSRSRALEEDIAATQEQFRQQREAALQVFRQLEAEKDGAQLQLRELQEQVKKLQEELHAGRSPSQRAGEGEKAAVAENRLGGMPAADSAELFWRMTVPLTLVLLSSDLLAMSFRSNPGMLEAARGLRQQSQKLMDLIRSNGLEMPPAQEPVPEATKPPASAATEA